MAQSSTSTRHGNAYNIFILVLTIISLAVMVVMLLPLSDETVRLLQFYDNFICIIFLIDFFLNYRAATNKSDYFIKRRGWLDLLGSIPSMGVVFKYSGLLRLARLSRFVRLIRLLRGKNKKQLIEDVLKNRSEYTVFLTILLVIIVLASASALVLQFESKSPDAKITTGWDAFWYSIVTITTVGYGDYYPVTVWGRITAMFVMVAGIGLIGVLASLLSSLLMGSTSQEESPVEASMLSLQQELANIKDELAAVRLLLEQKSMEGTNEQRDPEGARKS